MKTQQEIAKEFMPINELAKNSANSNSAKNTKLKTQQEIAKEFMPKHDNGATINKKK